MNGCETSGEMGWSDSTEFSPKCRDWDVNLHIRVVKCISTITNDKDPRMFDYNSLFPDKNQLTIYCKVLNSLRAIKESKMMMRNDATK